MRRSYVISQGTLVGTTEEISVTGGMVDIFVPSIIGRPGEWYARLEADPDINSLSALFLNTHSCQIHLTATTGAVIAGTAMIVEADRRGGIRLTGTGKPLITE